MLNGLRLRKIDDILGFGRARAQALLENLRDFCLFYCSFGELEKRLKIAETELVHLWAPKSSALPVPRAFFRSNKAVQALESD
jgi:hypothetical protein